MRTECDLPSLQSDWLLHSQASVKCLKPIKIRNPRYYAKTDNPEIRVKQFVRYQNDLLDYQFNGSKLEDYIYVPCGYCYTCLKRKSSDWRLRLLHEVSYNFYKKPLFVTFTFAPEYYEQFKDNVALAVRRFLERIRKVTKKSVRHWFITELGERTGRLHLHGFLFNFSLPVARLADFWKYGFVSVSSISHRRISYAVKYSLKPSTFVFKPQVFCSPGLGKVYTELSTTQKFHIRKNLLDDAYYCTFNGFTYSLPVYYRNKIFSEVRREQRLALLSRQKTVSSYCVCGVRVECPRAAVLLKEDFLRDTQRFLYPIVN